MNYLKLIAVFTTVGICGLTLSAPSSAQEAQTSTDLSNQSELLRGLEVGNQNEQEAVVEDNQVFNENPEFYNLNSSEQDVQLTELEEIQTWENTGDDEDTSVQVDIYDF